MFNKVYGIDFSGAQDAGKKIWIATAQIQDSSLLIKDCRPIKDICGSKDLYNSLTALYDFIVKEKAVFGLDFPFGLPRELVNKKSWEEFICDFPNLFTTPEHFKDSCFAAAGHKELKRMTDKESHTPFSAYNLKMYKQTYYGIGYILNPLVYNDLACILPMQELNQEKPQLIEICPASTLKLEGLYKPYKGSDLNKYQARDYILEQLEKHGYLGIKDDSMRLRILGDTEGDALDSVIAAFATFKALRNSRCLFGKDDNTNNYKIEGFVYV